MNYNTIQQSYIIDIKIFMNKINVEVCANSAQSAINAQKAGAIRVELCDNLEEGGTTPSLSQIEMARKSIDIQINTIIRPRGGDFLYNEMEFEMMQQDIHHCGQAKCDGVVFGILNADGTIDLKRNKILVDTARKYNMNITFHRAFDRCQNLFDALEEIIKLGFDHILTSGGLKTAPEGKETIKKLIDQANNRIAIMPGGGITENNISDLVKSTGLKEFHGSFRSRYNSNMEYYSPQFSEIIDEYSTLISDTDKIKKAISEANKV